MVLTQCALLVTGGSQLHEVAAVVTKDRGPSVWVGTALSCSADSAYQAVCSQHIPRNYDVTASSRADIHEASTDGLVICVNLDYRRCGRPRQYCDSAVT
jgi:hypothetical protein